MKNIFYSTTLFFLLLCVSQSQVIAQVEVEGRVSQGVLTEEAKFLEAQKQALIGRRDKAIEQFEAMYKKDRSNAAISFELTKLYVKENDAILVEKYGEAAIKNAPDNIHYLLFYSQYLLGQPGKEFNAIPYLKKLIGLDQKNAMHHDMYVDALLANENYDLAQQAIENMGLVFGNTEDILKRKYEVYLTSGNESKAIISIDRLIELFPFNKDYLKAKSALYLTKGNKAEALLLFKKVLEIDPNDTDANIALIDEGSEDENENTYLRALLPIMRNQSVNLDTKISEIVPYLEKLVDSYEDQLSGALIEVGEVLINTHPEEAKAHAIYGDILSNSNQVELAIKTYEKTLTLNDNIFPVWEQLMYSLDIVEDDRKLFDVSQEAVDLFPNQLISYFFMAKSGLTIDHIDALMYIDEAKMISVSNKEMGRNLMALTSLGLAKEGKTKEARASFDKIFLKEKEYNALLIEVAGDICFAESNNAGALKYWKAAQELGIHPTKIKNKIDHVSSF